MEDENKRLMKEKENILWKQKKLKKNSKWVFIYENIQIYICMFLNFIVLVQIILYAIRMNNC